MPTLARPPIARFVEKFDVNPDTLCWEWTRATFDNGYAAFFVGGGHAGGSKQAHRWSYQYFVGPVPEGLELDHLCRNRICVNPDHLEPVTHAVNVARGELGKTHRTKTACPRSHPYDDANTRVNKDGSRHCRTCHRERMKMRRAVAA